MAGGKHGSTPPPRIGIFGWGVVAPQSENIDQFAENLQRTDTWMTPFTDVGPSNFLVGKPACDIEKARPWVEQRFKPARFTQFLKSAGDLPQFALTAFINALEQNPGIEQCLQELGNQAHIYIGTGVGDYPTQYESSIALYKARRRWNQFWGSVDHCQARATYVELSDAERLIYCDQQSVTDPLLANMYADGLEEFEEQWEQHWCNASDELQQYLAQAKAIQSVPVNAANGGKANVIKNKRSAMKKLNKDWGCPTEPWAAVDPKLIWNIANAPAAQVSMLGKITGLAMAPVGACASFGVALKLAQNAIRLGEAKAVVVGMVDPTPHPLLVGAFYRANVASNDGEASKPLQGMKGTHIAGGACLWIVGDADYMKSKGFEPLGMEIAGIGTSSDANHIITPSAEGPLESIEQALTDAGIAAEQLSGWDMHCTATPGDESEVAMAKSVLPDVPMTARKGSFGHGMSVGGAWELTAQHLGAAAGQLAPTVLSRDELNEDIASLHENFVFDEPLSADGEYFGKINMGVGGINSCIISRRWDTK